MYYLLNNDTILSDNWLDSLYSTFDDTSVGICGSKLLYPDGTVQHAGIFFRPDLVPYHQFTRQPSSSPSVSSPLQVSAVTGASLMTRKSIFYLVGGIDESYGMYFEDIAPLPKQTVISSLSILKLWILRLKTSLRRKPQP